jgi:3-hydroxyisobutyrate dehydrogenase
MENNMLKVGFVGLGAMGWSMAGHLHHAGLLVAVANRSPEKAARFADEHSGVQAATDVGMLASLCDVVVSSVTADADVLALARELAARAAPGFVLVDTSTIASGSAQQAAGLLRAVGADFIDAPVSGGVEGARNGKLSVMAGGDASMLERVRPAIDTFAARITLMGPVGAGQNTKAVNQVLVAGIAQAVCEGLALGEALGLDADKLLPTLGAGAAANWFMDKRGATMLRAQYTPGFKLALLHKDLVIVRELAVAAGVNHDIIDLSLANYAALMQDGRGDEDTSALIRLKRAGGN